MLSAIPIPGLFITATDTGVGKTIIASAIASHFVRAGLRVGVCKPIASGCPLRDDGSSVSEDALMLSVAVAGRWTPDEVCPMRFLEPLAPSVAAPREGRRVEWPTVQAALARIVADSDVIIVEGMGGVAVPLDERYSLLDVIRWLRLPTLCVSRPSLGTINHTTLTVEVLRAARVEVAGVVVNRFDARTAGAAEATSAAEIERFASVPVRCVVPESYFDGYEIPEAIRQVVDRVDWGRLARVSPRRLRDR